MKIIIFKKRSTAQLLSMPAKFNTTFFLHIIIILIIVGLPSCAGSKKLAKRQKKVDTIIKTARSYTGTPYRYGGTTRSGMDCSALLLNSFKSAGVAIPRTSKEQSKIGKSVSFDKVKPGDLVFFAAKKGKRKITHVGLVTQIKSNGQVMFIHSSSSLGVVEADLRSKYYSGIFVKARRPEIN